MLLADKLNAVYVRSELGTKSTPSPLNYYFAPIITLRFDQHSHQVAIYVTGKVGAQ
jgi:hypothetical protein